MEKKKGIRKTDFKGAVKNKSVIRITSFDGDMYKGYAFKVTDLFVAIQQITDWHSDGIRVFPIDKVAGLRQSEHEAANESVLMWNGVEPTNEYEWLDLSSYEKLFTCLQQKEKTVWVGYDGRAQVGTINQVSADTVYTEDFHSQGYWMEGLSDTPFKDITDIAFDSEYITVLRAYADNKLEE